MTHEIRILTEVELRRAVPLDLAAVDVVEAAFAALAAGEVVMPPFLSMHLPQVNGEVDVKTAYIPGFEGFAIKVSPGFFDNPKLGLPSLNGLMVLLSARTGLVDALFLDNGYLTDVRTAAAGAVAARHLAPATVATAARARPPLSPSAWPAGSAPLSVARHAATLPSSAKMGLRRICSSQVRSRSNPLKRCPASVRRSTLDVDDGRNFPRRPA